MPTGDFPCPWCAAPTGHPVGTVCSLLRPPVPTTVLQGCVCPPGSEKTCQGALCPRKPFVSFHP